MDPDAADVFAVSLDDPPGGFSLSSPGPSSPAPPYALCNPFSPRLRRCYLVPAAGGSGSASFAPGAFSSTITLLEEVFVALQRNDGDFEEHVQLVAEIQSLESVILQVEAQYDQAESPAKRIALDQAVDACHKTVEAFVSSATKRSAQVSPNSPVHPETNVLSHVIWDLVPREELNIFRGHISAHVQSLQTLLVTIQV